MSSTIARVKTETVQPRAVKKRNNRLMHAAMKETQQKRAIVHIEGADPISAMQEVLDLEVANLRYAQQRCLELKEGELWRDTMAGKIPNEWIRLRGEYASKVAYLTGQMVKLDIADRAVKVEEAQAALVAQQVVAAAEAAGFDRDQVRRLGAALREIATESSA